MKDSKPASHPARERKEPGMSILSAAGATRRMGALFKAMADDFLLREQFVTDPSQVLSEYSTEKD